MRRRTLLGLPAIALLLASCAPGASGAAPVMMPAAARAEIPLSSTEGTASWYGPGFAGRKTASGETFDPSELTAAHRTLPFNTRVRVTNLSNGRSVVVRINDRGPFKGNRIIDLSRAAAERIGLLRSGTGRVRLETISGVGGILPTAPHSELHSYDVIANGRQLGELLVLASARSEPVLVRVVGTAVPPDAGAEILLSAELFKRLGPDVSVSAEL